MRDPEGDLWSFGTYRGARRSRVGYREPAMGILDAPDRWTIEWSESLASGKCVTLRNRITGQCASGHDWSDWDLALRRALTELAKEGDLVTEVEEFLRSR